MVDCWVGKHAAVAFLGDAAWILAWVVVVLCGGLWCGAVTVVVGPAVSGGAGMWPYRSSRNKVCLGWYGGLAVVVCWVVGGSRCGVDVAGFGVAWGT